MIWLFLAVAFAGDSLEELLVDIATHDAVRADLTSAEAAALAGQAVTPWRDPTVSIEISNAPVDSFDLSAHPMAGLQLRATWPLPRTGVAAGARAVAEEDGAAAVVAASGTMATLRLRVERAWWTLAHLRQLRILTAREIERTDQLVAAVQARYEVGGTGQHALLRLQVLRDRLLDDDARLAAEIVSWQAELEGAAGRPVEPDLPDEIAPIAPPPTPDAWIEALDAAPGVAGPRARKAREEAAAALARAQGRPQPTVWAGYRVRVQDAPDGVDQVSLGASVPLPLTAAPSHAREAERHTAMARGHALDAEAARRDLAAALVGHHRRWTQAHASAMTYAGTLRRAALQARDAALSDFRTGIADFAALYEAEIAWLEVERTWLRQAVATHIHDAEVRAILGQEAP